MSSIKKLRRNIIILIILFIPITSLSLQLVWSKDISQQGQELQNSIIQTIGDLPLPKGPQVITSDLLPESQQHINHPSDLEEEFRGIYSQVSPETVDQKGLKGKNVTIAVLDTGVNLNPWITSKQLVGNYTTVFNSTSTLDEDGHGTMVASIISKIAPEAHIISIRISNELGQIEPEAFRKGFELAHSLNVSIIHASVGTDNLNSLNSSFFSELDDQNVTTIFAAGNFGSSGLSLAVPAAYDEPIAVGMAYNRSIVPPTSSVGPRPSGLLGPDIVAPGVNISSYNHDGIPVRGSGTSFAAPFVTGAVALLRSNDAFPTAPPSLIKAALMEAAVALNDTPPILQGNGFLNISGAYERLKTLPVSPLFSFSPKTLSSSFPYFGHGINGITQKYRIGLYSSSSNVTLKSMNSSFISPVEVSIGLLPLSIVRGVNFLNLSLFIPNDVAMNLYEGPLIFSFANETMEWNINMTVMVRNHYQGGKILFYQGYDNDTFRSSGPAGTYSQLQLFLSEYYGMSVTGLIPPESFLSLGGTLVRTSERKLTSEDLEGFNALVLADIEWGISDEEIALIQDWVAEGHSLLVLSYPSWTDNEGSELFSNQTAINRLLEPYGIMIDDDPSLSGMQNPWFPRFKEAKLRPINPLTADDQVQEVEFSYNGTSLSLLPSSGAQVLATAPDLTNNSFEVPVGAYWQDNTSTGKVLVFGSELPFKDGSYSLSSAASNVVIAIRTFRWLIEDQRIPLELLLTSNPVVGSATTIQIKIEDPSFLVSQFNGTVVESNGSFSQIIFTRSINVYVGSWIPQAQGFAFLWLNLGSSGGIQSGGPFIVEVMDPASSNLLFLMIFGGIALLGLSFYLYSSRQTPQGSPLDRRLMVLQKQKKGTKKVSLETASICTKCRTPRYKDNSKYCWNCGKEL
ncbi:MAG: S8 family serine peptidase [Candidatus Thorarchaeota archaeon]